MVEPKRKIALSLSTAALVFVVSPAFSQRRLVPERVELDGQGLAEAYASIEGREESGPILVFTSIGEKSLAWAEEEIGPRYRLAPDDRCPRLDEMQNAKELLNRSREIVCETSLGTVVDTVSGVFLRGPATALRTLVESTDPSRESSTVWLLLPEGRFEVGGQRFCFSLGEIPQAGDRILWARPRGATDQQSLPFAFLDRYLLSVARGGRLIRSPALESPKVEGSTLEELRGSIARVFR